MHINPEMARRYGQPDEARIGVERGCMLSIGPHLHEAHSTIDLLTALFAQCQKVVPARLKPQLPLPKIDNRLVLQRPAQGYMRRLHKGIHPVPLEVVPAHGLGRTSLDLTEPPSSTSLRVDWSALAPDLPNVDYSSLNYTRDVLLHGDEVAYEVNSRWPRLLLHMQYELNGSSLLSVSAYRAVLGDQLTALLRAQGVLTI